jgi:hypothetical protein
LPLPVGGNVPWPPTKWRASYLRYGEHSAWYSGDPQQLQTFYSGYAGNDRTGFFDPATTAQAWKSLLKRFMFWARQQPGATTRQRIHSGLPGDIAGASSDLLFGDPPALIIPEAHVVKARTAAKDAQKRLDRRVDEDSMHSTFLESGEISAALGGVYQRVTWDPGFADRPLLVPVHPDAAVPEFRWGYLQAVTFWRTLVDDKEVIRHLERLEPGYILHGLYKGTRDKLGIPIPLTSLPETAALEAVIETGLKKLTAVYIPNMKPNRQERGSDLGHSDYSGSEGLLDSLDETWTSWLRDIRLGKGRIFISKDLARAQGRGKGSTFDVEQEIWEMIDMVPTDPNAKMIQPQQFEVRTKDHSDSCDAFVSRIIANAGYSGSTFGLKDAATVERTATEVKAREHRSLSTRSRKTEYYQHALADILEVYLMVDQKEFNGPVAFRPRVEFPETVQDSFLDRATAIQLLAQARAISLQTSVVMAHPEWDPDEVASEVKRIQDETAPVPVIGAGTTPPPDGTSTGAAVGASEEAATPRVLSMPPGTGGGLPPAAPPPSAT